MKLASTPDNRAPPGAVVATARAVDGVRLRTARWAPPTATRGTVTLLQGRAEFIEKYYETIAQLLERGFAVATMDWRGQGGSARPLKDRHKGHVDDFAIYERDINALVDDVLGPSCPQPWYGLCHSMGAAIMLLVAHAGRCPFDRIALTAPMIAPAGLRHRGAMHFIAEVLDTLGFGGAYAPGGRRAAHVLEAPFEGNVLTSDPVRYARAAALLAADPDLRLGQWTIGWIHAAFQLWRSLADADFARQIAGPPTLVVASGADQVVDSGAIERFVGRMRVGRLIVIEGARHEILMERDALRDQFWAAFDQFIPGVEAEESRRSATMAAPIAARPYP
jgi:lysophospholipase